MKKKQMLLKRDGLYPDNLIGAEKEVPLANKYQASSLVYKGTAVLRISVPGAEIST